MLILVDQDGVLADFEHRLYQTWQQATPTHEHPGVAPHERRHFYAKDDYPEHLRDAALSHLHPGALPQAVQP